MGKALGKRCVWSLCGVLAGVMMTAVAATAEVTTDLSGSVLHWPKVLAGPIVDIEIDDNGGAEGGGAGKNGEFVTVIANDTVIQLTNTSNNLVHVQCYYIDASPFDPRFPPGPFNPPRWQETDFHLWLTRQQPYHWVVSQGRFVNPFDDFGEDGAGLDAGAVPPVPPGFQGELKCVQVDASGVPFGGNNLKGEAVIRRLDGDVSKYNAVAILANPDLAPGEPSNELRLDNTPSNDGEYNSCPNTLLLNHFADGAPDPIIEELTPRQCFPGPGAGAGLRNGDAAPLCPVRTELTLVPCSQDLENQIPETVKIQFQIFNEFEQLFSASTSVTCWLNISLGDITAARGECSLDDNINCVNDLDCIRENAGFCEKSGVFSFEVLGTTTAYTRIQPVDPDGGVIGVAQESHLNRNAAFGPGPELFVLFDGAKAAYGLQQEGNRFDATNGEVVDVITTIPNL